MDIPAYTERNLIEHQNQKYEDLALSDVVQTATFIFNPEGESRNLQIP
jgi:hypothetical protein